MSTDEGSILGRLCDAAFERVIRNALEGYVVVGGTAAAQSFTDRRGYGLDLVWDLWNEQFAAFTYPLIATAWPTFGAGLTAYAGLGFGMHQNILEAWSGQFTVSEASMEVSVWRLIELEGQLTYFASPHDATVGGAVGITAAVGVPRLAELFRLPLGASVARAVDHWTACDPITRRLFDPRVPGSRLIRLDGPKHDSGHGGGHDSGHGGGHDSGHGDGHGGGEPHFVVDVSPGLWGVSQHLESILGSRNGLYHGFSLYANAVSLVKEFIRGNGMAENGRAAGLEALHRWLCNEHYRLVRNYIREVPSGTEQREYENNRYTVQRTNTGKFLITALVGRDRVTGSWSTVMRVVDGNGTAVRGVPGVRFRMVGAGTSGSRGIIGGRSYSMTAFSNEVMRLRQRMMNA